MSDEAHDPEARPATLVENNRDYTLLPAYVCNVSAHPIDIETFPTGRKTDFYFPLWKDATGMPLQVPFIVARGSKPGPVLGITAAVHGNELNGIKIIQDVLNDLDLDALHGSVFCAPVVNVPAYRRGQRYFIDGEDLNRLFPGRPQGVPAEQYAYAFCQTFLPPCNFLIDLHTASEGRTNTLYVRADLHSSVARAMAEHVNPQIILHVPGKDGTLRHAAARLNIPAITIEAGNPSVIQGKMVFDGEVGVRNVMTLLGLLKGEPKITRSPVVCRSNKWIRTTGGGLLETHFRLYDRVTKRQLLAETTDMFGRPLEQYFAPHDGIVIGKAVYPVAIPGTRFCNLGTIGEPQEKSAKDAAKTKAGAKHQASRPRTVS
ncbi:MAG: succinylglutamate desuccinylase/aspartoacylase family protein [Bdellovibrionales bacterium]|nr:succinylglutamate desuccinylase/aspartoacylase family protein [Bdellovibrionales bacterium]